MWYSSETAPEGIHSEALRLGNAVGTWQCEVCADMRAMMHAVYEVRLPNVPTSPRENHTRVKRPDVYAPLANDLAKLATSWDDRKPFRSRRL